MFFYPPTQAALLGYRDLEEVPWVDLRNERSVCDLCTSSLPNLHVSCGGCGWDVCVRCLAEHHEKQRQGGREEPRESPLEPPGAENPASTASQHPRRRILCLNSGCEFSLASTCPGGQDREKAEWPVTASRYFETPRLHLLRAMVAQVDDDLRINKQ